MNTVVVGSPVEELELQVHLPPQAHHASEHTHRFLGNLGTHSVAGDDGNSMRQRQSPDHEGSRSFRLVDSGRKSLSFASTTCSTAWRAGPITPLMESP